MSEPLVDIGLNLTSKQFASDREEVVERALAAGVARMMITGLSAGLSQAALELARGRPNVFRSTAGVHPHNAKSFDRHTQAELRALAVAPEVAAVGECGLDYERNFSPPEEQRHAFEAQLELAVELGKPVFLHERRAHEDFARILVNVSGKLRGGVVHCFTGTAAELERYLGLGLCVGITGFICDERRGTHLREVVKLVPEGRLMIETDAPFLLPRDMKGTASRRNEPAFLPHIAASVARARGESELDVARHTSATASRVFGLAVLALTLLVMAVSGCKREEDKVSIDAAALSQEVQRRAEAMMNRPSINQQLDRLFDGIAKDPAASASGEAVLAALGAAPELATAFEAMQTQIGELKQMHAIVSELMKANPGASPERIGELAGERVGQVTEGPVFDQAFDMAFNRLLLRPKVKLAFEDLGRRISNNPAVRNSISKAFETQANDLKFRRRIVELNGGKAPDSRRATALVAERAFSEQRLERFYLDLFSLPAVSRELGVAVKELLSTPTFVRHSRKTLVILLSEKRAQQGLVDAFALLLEREPSVDKLGPAITGVLDSPEVERCVATFLTDLMSDPELAVIGDRALARIAVDPSFNTMVVKFADGW